MVAIGIKLGDVNIGLTGTRQNPSSKVDGAPKGANENHIAIVVSCNMLDVLGFRITEPLAPEVLAARIEFCHIDVITSCVGQRPSAKIGIASKIISYEYVIVLVNSCISTSIIVWPDKRDGPLFVPVILCQSLRLQNLGPKQARSFLARFL